MCVNYGGVIQSLRVKLSVNTTTSVIRSQTVDVPPFEITCLENGRI